MKVVLVADKLPERCIQILTDGGLEAVNRPGLAPDELREAVRGVHGIVCRSGAKITADILEAADSLEAVCRAGVGVDNIDVPAASRKGVVVMNTPGGNTVSTAEHAFALMIGLARNIGPAYISMRERRWDKKRFIGSQLAGSTLGGLINAYYGRVGLEWAVESSEYSPLAALIGGRIYFTMGLDMLMSRALTVAIIAALASLYPAWQASQREPAEALHYV